MHCESVLKKQNGLLDELDVLLHDQHANALHITGRCGTGKSYIVKRYLTESFGISHDDKENKKWAYYRGSLSPLGLFQFLKQNRKRIIVFDDVTELFANKKNQGFLLGAMEPGEDRWLIHSRSRPAKQATDTTPARPAGIEQQQFHFLGKIISIANFKICGDPVRDALGDRCITYELDYTQNEMAAFLVDLARAGQRGIEAKEAQQVLEVTLALCAKHNVRPTLRIYLDKALIKYRNYQQGIGARVDWKDRLSADIQSESTGGTIELPLSRLNTSTVERVHHARDSKPNVELQVNGRSSVNPTQRANRQPVKLFCKGNKEGIEQTKEDRCGL